MESFNLDEYSNFTFKELVDKIIEEKEDNKTLRGIIEVLKKQIKKEFDIETNKMEQGIGMLEELGWRIFFQSKRQLVFIKSGMGLQLVINVHNFYSGYQKNEESYPTTLEEAKACIMIMEAMKNE